MKKQTLLLLVISFFCIQLQSQSLSPWVISSAGGYASNASYSVSWTLGEIAVTTISNASYSLGQGFQNGVSIATGIDDMENLIWSFQLYPNPVKDRLYISFELAEPTDIVIEVLDLAGRKFLVHEYDRLTGRAEKNLDVSTFDQGLYLLHIYSKDYQISKTFQFQKY
jgi:hypothetical protein